MSDSPFQMDSIIIESDREFTDVVMDVHYLEGKEAELTELIEAFSSIEDSRIKVRINQTYGCVN